MPAARLSVPPSAGFGSGDGSELRWGEVWGCWGPVQAHLLTINIFVATSHHWTGRFAIKMHSRTLVWCPRPAPWPGLGFLPAFSLSPAKPLRSWQRSSGCSFFLGSPPARCTCTLPARCPNLSASEPAAGAQSLTLLPPCKHTSVLK